MQDITVMRKGKFLIVELPDEEVKVKVEPAEEVAENLRIETEEVAILKAIIQNAGGANKTWEEFEEMIKPALDVVGPELLIEYMVGLPEYILRNAGKLFAEVRDKFSGDDYY